MRVELVNIETLARALTGPTERDLAKPAEFVEHIRYMDRLRHVHFEITRTAKQTARRQRGDLGCHVGCWCFGCNVLRSLLLASSQSYGGVQFELLASREQMRAPAEIIHLVPRCRHR